jgi:hypothetical protein
MSLMANKDVAKVMFEESLEVLIEKISTWEGFEEFVEPLTIYKNTFMERGMKSYTPGSFSVLNHGDFHLKNILYKMADDNKVEDFVFLDFQIAIYASPAIDLSYVLYNFVSDENRANRYDEVLQVYHEQFVESLKKFGFIRSPPSLLDLQVEMMKNGNVQVFLATCFYPFLIADFSTFTVEDFAAGPRGFKEKMFSTEHFRGVLRTELPKFLHKGYLG